MKFQNALFSLGLILSCLTSPAAEPSFDNCEYYQTLESHVQCGPQSYLQRWGYPMCENYRQMEPTMSAEIQAWFPKVRYCLQDYLQQNEGNLNCDSLDEIAKQSHVDCYLETGFCELPNEDKLSLLLMVGHLNLYPIWLQTSLEIAARCL